MAKGRTFEHYKDRIECPMCAEYVKEKAKICRFCGHKFKEIDPHKQLYDVYFYRASDKEEVVYLIENIFGFSDQKARSYILYNDAGHYGCIKERSLDEAKSFQSEIEGYIGGKVNYNPSKG